MADGGRDAAFCVITPSYEQGAFIERTILSVLGQDVGGLDAGLDYLVVDGGSRDGTVEILRRHEDRLRWISEPDGGQADAVNKGLAATRAELVGWLNSDDVYYPGALAKVRAFFAAHPEVDVVYGEAHHVDVDDAVIEPYPTEPWDPERLVERCFLCQPAVFFRRRVVERCGPLDARLHYCLDYEYWLRLARQGVRFAHLPEVLAGSRLYAANKTLGQRLRVHAEINGMLRRTLGRVPDRWLANHAHAATETTGLKREDSPRRFAIEVAVRTWAASLRWNHGVSRSLWRTTWGWILSRAGSACRPDGENRQAQPDLRSRRRPPALRIGFDVSQTGTAKAGCGYAADGLVQALAAIDDRNEYVLYPTFGDDYWDPEGPEATRRVERPSFRRGLTHPTQLAARDFWRRPPSDLEARLGHPDVVHSHNFFCPPGLERARLVYTLYDLSFLVHPEWTTEHNRRICFEGVFRASLWADMVLAISEATRRHFLETFPHYPEERTAVMPLASRFAGAAPVPRPPALSDLDPEGFWLNVGTVEPRKNPLRLLEAYAACRDATRPLVIAGGRGWLMDGFEHRIAELGLTRHVRLLGYVDDGALQWLYQNCFAFLYPSLFEGFGLPVVEALSQGAAVVTSDVTSLPEVAGEAALLVDPRDGDAITGAIERLAAEEELRAELRAKAPAQASRYSWRRTAETVLGCYERVVAMERFEQGA